LSSVYSVESVTKTYARGHVLANQDISFTIQRGDIFGLLGPNGAGKTTLLKQMLGLMRPDSGRIELFGHNIVTDSTSPSKYVSCMSQRPNVLADLTVREALVVTGHLRGQLKPTAQSEATALLEEFELGSIANRLVGKLSGGQQRLVSFVLALTGLRPVLVLDEPTNDLDPTHRRILWNKLTQLNREQGTTIILVTHNVIEAERVLRTVGIINKGRIMTMGPVDELKAQVDNRLRVEIRPTIHRGARIMHILQLLNETLPEASIVENAGTLVIMGTSSMAERAMQVVLRDGFSGLADFRIVGPSLEDVYLSLGGGEQLVKHDASA